MTHQFDIELAKEFGIEEAILIDKFVGWIQYNRANNKHFHDGRTWTYNSAKSFADIFPYMTESKIKRVISALVDAGIIMKGNYNENQYDRTNWYAFTDAGNTIVQKCYFHRSEMTNGTVRNERPIPNNQPNNQPYIFTPSDEGSDGCLFDDAGSSTLTMLSSEEIPFAGRGGKEAEKARTKIFESMWLMYERKGSKAKARKEFDKLTEEEIDMMDRHIPAYLQSRPERQYRQDFERYIKHKTFTSVVYSKTNEVLYDPESPDTSVTRTVLPESLAEDATITINGVIYR